MKTLGLGGCGPIVKAVLLLATGFGLGLFPYASGTAGTVLGVLLVVALPLESVTYQVLLSAVLIIVAIPICSVAERHFGKKDDGRIVADEYLSYPLCVIALPWQEAPWLLVLAFLTHRFFDIVKPFPARGLQSLTGGLGIVADDVISSFYALGVNHLVWWIVVAITR